MSSQETMRRARIRHGVALVFAVAVAAVGVRPAAAQSASAGLTVAVSVVRSCTVQTPDSVRASGASPSRPGTSDPTLQLSCGSAITKSAVQTGGAVMFLGGKTTPPVVTRSTDGSVATVLF